MNYKSLRCPVLVALTIGFQIGTVLALGNPGFTPTLYTAATNGRALPALTDQESMTFPIDAMQVWEYTNLDHSIHTNWVDWQGLPIDTMYSSTVSNFTDGGGTNWSIVSSTNGGKAWFYDYYTVTGWISEDDVLQQYVNFIQVRYDSEGFPIATNFGDFNNTALNEVWAGEWGQLMSLTAFHGKMMRLVQTSYGPSLLKSVYFDGTNYFVPGLLYDMPFQNRVTGTKFLGPVAVIVITVAASAFVIGGGFWIWYKIKSWIGKHPRNFDEPTDNPPPPPNTNNPATNSPNRNTPPGPPPPPPPRH